jgi:hypothetical protein
MIKAIKNNDLTTAQYLVSQGVDVTAQDNQAVVWASYVWSPSHRPVVKGRIRRLFPESMTDTPNPKSLCLHEPR